MAWLIRNQNDRALFWSDTQGWVDIAYEDLAVLNDAEKATSRLPIEGEWVDPNNLADAPDNSPDPDLTIGASAHSDDHRVEVDFDAAPWFKKAIAEDILSLVYCQWGGDYPADDIAQSMAEHEAQLARMFDYISIANTDRITIGFECHVETDDARAWLNRHRPELLPVVLRMEEDGEDAETAKKAIETILQRLKSD